LSTLCAAVAVAQTLGVSTDLIRAGLKSFSQKSTSLTAPSKGIVQ
jgi:UDP-N-acetylmuramyl pentapeptide synthase